MAKRRSKNCSPVEKEHLHPSLWVRLDFKIICFGQAENVLRVKSGLVYLKAKTDIEIGETSCSMSVMVEKLK